MRYKIVKPSTYQNTTQRTQLSMLCLARTAVQNSEQQG